MPRRGARHHHHVYVVELSDRVWNEASFRKANPDWQLGKPFIYVGMTGSTLICALTGTRPAFRPIDSSVRTVCACCRTCTKFTTQCLTRPRGRWKWNSQSVCARPATACGRPERAHRLTVSNTRLSNHARSSNDLPQTGRPSATAHGRSQPNTVARATTARATKQTSSAQTQALPPDQGCVLLPSSVSSLESARWRSHTGAPGDRQGVGGASPLR
jgi:hypothetical protein